MSSPTVTVVVETYNLGEGQSHDSLVASLRAATLEVRPDADGPQRHRLLLMDPIGDDRVAAMLSAMGVEVQHVRLRQQTGYDVFKNLAAEMAETDVVLYLDGDCEPCAGGAAWADRMVAELLECGAPGVGGITVYRGRTPLHLACSVLDFGFLASAASQWGDGALGCYASLLQIG